MFGRGNKKWISELRSNVKTYNNITKHSMKKKPTVACGKFNKNFIFSSLHDKRKKRKPKIELIQKVRTANIKRTFSKGFSTNWS